MIRNRVKLAVGLLVGSKLLNVTVPFLFKFAVDDINTKMGTTNEAILNFASASDTILSTAVAILVGCKSVSYNMFFL